MVFFQVQTATMLPEYQDGHKARI